jgi:hypothetical protein
MGGPGGINSADELEDFKERAEMALKLLGGERSQQLNYLSRCALIGGYCILNNPYGDFKGFA